VSGGGSATWRPSPRRWRRELHAGAGSERSESLRYDGAIVLDCRWLGIGGPGRTTELILRGLTFEPPSGRWLLWGDEAAIRAVAWPGAEIVPISEDPRRLHGQRRIFEVPRGDFVVYMHQQRPLRAFPCVTMIYDTIALRYGTNSPVRKLKRAFLRWVAASSRGVLTISEHSRSSVIRDLSVASSKVEVLRFPFDDALAARVSALRGDDAPADDALQDVALFVGGFLPHKNLPRLIAAFEATAFRRDGGKLMLLGGTASQASEFLAHVTPAQREWLIIRQACPQAELDQLFASTLFLVQPSLEEGFGLPAWEALCCGMTVCASDGGALGEAFHGFVDPFPAASSVAMTAAIDECARHARLRTPDDRRRQIDAVRDVAPTIAELGTQFRTFVESRYATVPARRASSRSPWRVLGSDG
jgi:glycosyltransferase involved in cell wall biosynthesis